MIGFESPFRLSKFLSLIGLFWIAAFIGSDGHAVQVGSPQTSDRPSLPDKVPSILEGGSAKPDAIHLRGKGGEAIYVPLQAYEDFEKFLRERLSGSVVAPPEQLLESLVGECRIGVGFAEIDWTAKAQVGNAKGGTYRIPLGMPNQNLVDPPSLQPGVSSLVRLSPNGGYEWWLQGEDSKRFEIRFKTRMKMNSTGNQSTLRFALVDVPVRINLTLPGPNQEIQATGNGVPVVETQVVGDSTTATILGVGGALNVTWKDKVESSSFDSLEIESITRWEINSDPRPWSGSTRFTVRPFGKKRSREFQIRVPNGMRWSPEQNSRLIEGGIELIPMDSRNGASKENGKASDATQSFRVRINELIQEGPIEFTIAWEWMQLPDGAGHFQLKGPLCSGVQRQEGRVELDIPNGYRLGFPVSSDIMLLQQERTNDPTPGTRYSLRFSNPEYLLSAVLTREESQVRIRPRYSVHVESERVVLNGAIEFAVDPSSISDFRLHLGDWVLDRLEFDGRIVEYETIEDGTIQPRLQDSSFESNPSGSSALPGPVRGLRLFAFLPWSPTKDRLLRIVLPKISSLQVNGTDRRYEHGTGGLLLSHATNVHLESETQTVEGLVAEQRIPPSMEDLSGVSLRRDGQYFRFQSDTAAPIWSGEWSKRNRLISVRRKFEIELDESRIRANQFFQIQIDNEPLQRMRLLAPKSLVESNSPEKEFVRILIDGEPVDWSVVPLDASEELPSADWKLIELVGSPYSGSLELQIESLQSLPKLSLDRLIDHSIRLVWPVFINENSTQTKAESSPIATPQVGYVQLLDGNCELHTVANIRCDIDSTYLAEDVHAWSSRQLLSIPSGVYEIPCKIGLLAIAESPSVRIDRMWMQSSMSSHQQRNRMVARFSTKSPSVQVILPRDRKNLPFQDSFLLDGKPIEPTRVGDFHRFAIPNSPNSVTSDSQVHVLEIWTLLNRSNRLLEPIRIDAPQFENANRDIPCLWQVMLPPGESLIAASPSLVPEYRWSWKSFGIYADNLWKQLELENWVGATHPTPLGSQTANYVLSCSGDVSGLWILSIPRFLIWLPVGGLFLIGFAAWGRFGLMRKPLTLVAAGVVVACVVPLATDFALLLAQTIAISFLLGIVVLVTQWAIDHRIQKRSVFANRHLTRSRSLSPDPSGRALQGQSTTQAAGSLPSMEGESS